MPPKHRDIHISGIDIHREAEAPRRLRRDDGAAAAAERLVDGIVRRMLFSIGRRMYYTGFCVPWTVAASLYPAARW